MKSDYKKREYNRIYSRNYRAKYPEKVRKSLKEHYNKEYHQKWYQENKEGLKESHKEWVKENPEKIRKACRKWRKANPEKARIACRRSNKNNLERKAGRKKPEQCEICGGFGKDLNKGLCFDHNHETGKFRGWICSRCNVVLGYVEDNPKLLIKLIKYLNRKK